MPTDTNMGACSIKLAVSAALCILAFGSDALAQAAQPKEPPTAAQPPAPTVATRGWEVSCDTGPAGLTCFASQKLYRDKQRVLTVYVLAPSDNPAPKLVIRLPLGIYLPAGVVIQFGKGEAKQLLIERCGPRGCYPADYPLTEADLDALLKGADLTISARDRQQQPVTFVVQAEGFPAAYTKIK